MVRNSVQSVKKFIKSKKQKNAAAPPASTTAAGAADPAAERTTTAAERTTAAAGTASAAAAAADPASERTTAATAADPASKRTTAAPDAVSGAPKESHIDNLFEQLKGQNPGKALTQANAGAVMPSTSPIQTQAKAEPAPHIEAEPAPHIEAEENAHIEAEQKLTARARERKEQLLMRLAAAQLNMSSARASNPPYAPTSDELAFASEDSDNFSRFFGPKSLDSLCLSESSKEEAKRDTPDGSEAGADQCKESRIEQYQAVFRPWSSNRKKGLGPSAFRGSRGVMPGPSDSMQKNLQNNLKIVTLADPAGQHILDNFEALYRPTYPKYDSGRQNNADSTRSSRLPSSMGSSNMAIIKGDADSTTSSILPSSIADSTRSSSDASSSASSTTSSSDTGSTTSSSASSTTSSSASSTTSSSDTDSSASGTTSSSDASSTTSSSDSGRMPLEEHRN